MNKIVKPVDSLSSYHDVCAHDACGEKDNRRRVSFFEFWPGWIMYFPVGLQWIGLSLWYRSMTLPFLANPRLTLSGMVGVGKSELMTQATGLCKETILPWVLFTVHKEEASTQAQECLGMAAAAGIHLPFVCKPDIGCRGVGVKLVKNAEELERVIACYPVGVPLICQKLASWEPEVGIFYVKNPEAGCGNIVSLTFKYLPTVMGDGVSTLGALVQSDPRAGQLQYLYEARHKHVWHSVPAHGEVVRLVFSASHSKGAIFRDGRAHITDALTQKIDDIMMGLPEFYYGRLDVKFSDLESLKMGKNMQVVEINGASAESIHIWDKDAKFWNAIKTLLWQYRTLFRIGAYHRKNGHTPPSLKVLIRHCLKERRLVEHYPPTD